ncbi:FAD dependent oxidoreductase [Mucidula mucida]|nr:FAD dependent oxidoreductase [Mucidula mucida]
MGTLLSKIRLTFETLRQLAASYDELNKKLSLSPGLPLPNPLTPFWANPPSPLAQHGAEDCLPTSADVIIIGSGIAGTSFAREFLAKSHLTGKERTVMMLEARDVCSGATARNGGHITPPLYHDYQALEKAVGAETAKRIIRFRRAHLHALLRAAEEEGLLEYSQCRKVDTYDAFFELSVFESLKLKLEYFLKALPEENGLWEVLEGPEALSDLQLCDRVIGAIKTNGGAVHPYRLVTGILARLLKSYSSFQLYTHTPCTNIASSAGSYRVVTPRGTITTKHIVHASNAWTSHLVEPMRRKIVPIRGHMTAQRPGTGLGHVPTRDDASHSTITQGPSWLGTRSFVFYYSTSEDKWDYLTQQPQTPSSNFGKTPHAEFMFGGGVAAELGGSAFFDAIGCVDDRSMHFPTQAYLGGALATYFGEHWGGENIEDEQDSRFEAGRVKKAWSGILGISADMMPWVGKLPSKLSGRPTFEDHAEWIVAGFTGEGMTHAWISGKALASMILGREEEDKLSTWFPDVFRATEKRWKRAKLEDRI